MKHGARTAWTVVIAIAALGGVGCAVESGAPEPTANAAGGLTVAESTSTHVAGSYVDAVQKVEFDARLVAENDIVVRVQLGARTLSLHANYATGAHDLDGGGAAFGIAEKDTLRALAERLANALGGDARTLALPAQTLVGVTSYWSEAPTSYVHAPRTVKLAPLPVTGASRPLGFGNDGISCVYKGSWYTASYDGANGATSESVQAGSNWGTGANGGDYGCMGRCGAGCSGFSLFARYTRDCLEHDACSYRYAASGGGSDPNCGDEYNEAYDDFMNLGWYGCGG